jgi:hypothetical protein
MHPPRSAIPRVVGIIGIPLACVGVGGSLPFGPLHDIESWRAAEHLASTVNWL